MLRKVDALMAGGCFVCAAGFAGTASACVATIEIRLLGDMRPRADVTAVFVCEPCAETLEREKKRAGG